MYFAGYKYSAAAASTLSRGMAAHLAVPLPLSPRARGAGGVRWARPSPALLSSTHTADAWCCVGGCVLPGVAEWFC